MAHIIFEKLEFPRGHFGDCTCCNKEWSKLYALFVGDSELWLCPDCLEILKKKLNKKGEK